MFQHLKDKNINYTTHFRIAFRMSYLSLKASIKLFIHALIPSLFTNDGTELIKFINNIYCQKKLN